MIRSKQDVKDVMSLIRETSEKATAPFELFGFHDDSGSKPCRTYVRYSEEWGYSTYSEGQGWRSQGWSMVRDIEQYLWKHRKQVNNYFRTRGLNRGLRK